MMKSLISQPFIFLAAWTCLFFGFGDLLKGYWPLSITACLMVAIFIVVKFKSGTSPWFILYLIPLSLLIQLRWSQHQKDHHELNLLEKLEVQNMPAIIQKIEVFDDCTNLIIQLTGQSKNTKAKIRLKYTIVEQSMSPGDSIWLDSKLTRPIQNSEFDEFNYSAYLSTQHIHYTDHFDAEICHHSETTAPNIYKWAHQSKCYTKDAIRKLILDPDISGLMIALLLGDKSQVDQTIKSQFMTTGTAHILAVSGLHLGIVYSLSKMSMLALVLLFPGLKRFTPIFHIFNIWAFSFITGLGSSVVRAAVMISLLELGINLKRQTHSIHILACSAFSMMMYNPCFIYDIGFQLSVVAVLSIILFETAVYSIIKGIHTWYNYLMKIISVSVAVQILITPISIYHFGSFPIYFIIANLVWIPLSFLLMFGGILLVFIEIFSTTLGLIIGQVCTHLIKIGLLTFQKISELPLPYLDHLTIFPEQVLLSLAGFLSLYAWLHSKGMKWIQACFTCFAFLGLVWPIRYTSLTSSREIIFYSQHQNILAELRIGNEMYSFIKTDSRKYVPSKLCRKSLIQKNTIVKMPSSENRTYCIPLKQQDKICIHKNYWDGCLSESHKINFLLLENQKYLDTSDFQNTLPEYVIIGKKNEIKFKKLATAFFQNKNTHLILLDQGTYLKPL